MIIQCAQCKARFRLDDSKVSDAGIKVRCSKCKHIFVVKREAPVEEADLDVLLQGLDSTRPGSLAAAAVGTAATGAAAQEAGAALSSASEASFSPGGARAEETSEPTAEGPEGETQGGSFGVESVEKQSVDFGEESRSEEPFGNFEFERDDSLPAVASDESAFPVGDAGALLDGAAVGERGAFDEEEISFGEVSPEAFAAATDVSASVTEGSEEEEISFEFDDDEEADDLDGAGAGRSTAGDVDFGEIDFGIEDAESGSFHGGASLLTVASATETAVAPESETMGHEASPEASMVSPVPLVAGAESEPPPLSIASRRKGKSLFPVVVIALSVLVIVFLAGLGFYFFKEGPEALDKFGVGFLAEWLGMEGREEGMISLDKVEGAYLVNGESGEVFVIRGEAVNNYRKPRAAIQVRGALLGAGGQVLVQKVAYCGNSLTDEQIASLPFARIEAAMANQFGDSLANLGVQPEKRIPFVIVIAGVPKEAVDYSVEVVGSTVASQ